MRAAFYTLGCKVNQYETTAMEEQFVRAGFELVEPQEEADVYVLNSCTVTAESDKKSRQQLRRFRRQNPAAVIALCGCMPQAFPNVAEAIPEANVILGTGNKGALLGAVTDCLAGLEQKVVLLQNYHGKADFERTAVSTAGDRTRAFLKIQDGCTRYCAYCIIPKARGPIRSKPLADITKEVTQLAAAGYREVVLVGINLSCYGVDFGAHLLDAVTAACVVEGIERVRLGSLEPELLDAAVISRLAQLPKLCPQFHLSLQSGCNTTLARMRRHYTTADYRTIVANLRASFPGCAITTDIMVGFPGETAQEFAESLAFVTNIQIAKAHVFAYSRRSGTTADNMPDQIDAAVKAERSKQMLAAMQQTRHNFLQQQVGTVQTVLFETQRPDSRYEGYTPNYSLVVVDSPTPLKGLLSVSITKVEEDYCLGHLAEQ